MAQGCLLDTSFLITLADRVRPNHATARSYFRHALDEGIPLYLSTVIAMEFSRRQPIEQLGLHQFIVLPLNLPEAVLAAQLAEASPRDPEDDRVAVPLDFAVLAQAEKTGIEVVLTEDAKTLHKHCERLRALGVLKCRTVLLEEGFDPSRLIDPGAPGLPFPPSSD